MHQYVPSTTGIVEPKGYFAEASAYCLGRGRWAVGEYPPDCHESGALSCNTLISLEIQPWMQRCTAPMANFFGGIKL